MRKICLDLAVMRTGYAVYDGGILVDYGAIEVENYQGHSKDRYPKKTIINCRNMADQVVFLIKHWYCNDTEIIIEEINTGRYSVKAIKGLAMLHGIILNQLSDEILSIVKIIKCSEWRKNINLKKDGDWKESSIKHANNTLGLELESYQHDEADAINIGLAYI